MDKENELKLLFESNEELFYSFDVEKLKLTFISESCSHIFGYDAEFFLTDSLLLFNLVHADFKDFFNPISYKYYSADIVEFDYQIIQKSGLNKWVKSRVKPVFNSQGKLIQINGAIRDISEIKVKELELENKIKELNFYIYRITHDLRGPISSTQGLIYLAKREAKEEPLIKYINKIEESNKKIDSILLNLIEVIRTLKGTAITKELINFESIINEILLGVEHNPKRKGITINVDIKLFYDFYSDTKLINSILLNLIHNAINYHDKSTDAFIFIEIKSQLEVLKIIVKDNGSGIAEDIKSKVFDMFYRGNENSKGSGLGLYIVKSAVEKLGGKIELQSNLGTGTTFSIDLPLK